MHVVGLQLDLAWENAAENRERAALWLDKATPEAGSLVVLPEMFSSGFTMAPERVAEAAGGSTEQWLAHAARERRIHLVAGLARRVADGFVNEAVVFDTGGVEVASYRKRRLFRPGGEHQHYSAGVQPTVFGWEGIRVALFICYDLRFPALFLSAARERPELLVVIASWPDRRVNHWMKLLQARAIENQAYVLGVNRTGADPTHRYPGRSLLVNPWGEPVGDAGEGEGWVEGKLDLSSLRDYRAKLPFLEDSLIDPSPAVSC